MIIILLTWFIICFAINLFWYRRCLKLIETWYERCLKALDIAKMFEDRAERAEAIKSIGKWKTHKDGSGTCPFCHFTQKAVWNMDRWQEYCGHCGAKMEGIE